MTKTIVIRISRVGFMINVAPVILKVFLCLLALSHCVGNPKN